MVMMNYEEAKKRLSVARAQRDHWKLRAEKAEREQDELRAKIAELLEWELSDAPMSGEAEAVVDELFAQAERRSGRRSLPRRQQ